VIYFPINACGQIPQNILPKLVSDTTINKDQKSPQNKYLVKVFSFVGSTNPMYTP